MLKIYGRTKGSFDLLVASDCRVVNGDYDIDVDDLHFVMDIPDDRWGCRGYTAIMAKAEEVFYETKDTN
jgi:hypothetical protein